VASDDFAALLSGESPKKKGGRSRKLYPRYDPETGARVMVDRDDPRYDEFDTPAQRKAAVRRDGGSKGQTFTGTVSNEIAKTIGRDITKPFSRGKGGAAAAKRVAKRGAGIVKGIVKGAGGAAVGGAGAAAAGIAAALGLMYGAKALGDKMVRDDAKVIAAKAGRKSPTDADYDKAKKAHQNNFAKLKGQG
jgi:hypothetical protein